MGRPSSRLRTEPGGVRDRCEEEQATRGRPSSGPRLGAKLAFLLIPALWSGERVGKT